MSDQLVIEGFVVPVAVGSTYEVEPWGDFDRAFSGRQRSDIRAHHRRFQVETVELDSGDALALELLLQSPGPLECSGDLVGVVARDFHARGVRRRPITATDSVISFELHETQDTTESALLFSFDGDAEGTYTFTRTGTAYYIDSDGVLQSAAANEARFSWPLVDGVRAPSLLLEGARTNLALHSTDISNAVWDVSGAAKSAATSLVSGGTAQEIASTGSGAEALRQTIGTLTATPETLSFLVENVDAVVTRLGIYDSTAVAFVAEATLTWATGALSTPTGTAGSARSIRARYMGVGPNGGDVYLVEITGTPANAGNTRQVWLYPGGQLGNTQAVIVHYGQHEVGRFASSLIVTGAASATRNLEGATFPIPSIMGSFRAAGGGTIYFRWNERGTAFVGGSADRYWQMGDSNRVLLFSDATDGQVRGQLFANSTAYSSNSGGGVVDINDPCEARIAFYQSGGSWYVQLHVSVDGAAEVSGSAVEIGPNLPDLDVNTLVLNNNAVAGSAPGFCEHESLKIAAGTKTLAEMRALSAARLHPRTR